MLNDPPSKLVVANHGREDRQPGGVRRGPPPRPETVRREVEDGSLASQGGLQVGDVIETAAGINLKSVDQLDMIFEEAKKAGQPIRVTVRRGNTRMLLVIR